MLNLVRTSSGYQISGEIPRRLWLATNAAHSSGATVAACCLHQGAGCGIERLEFAVLAAPVVSN
jgi:hypothetical protein